MKWEFKPPSAQASKDPGVSSHLQKVGMSCKLTGLRTGGIATATQRRVVKS